MDMNRINDKLVPLNATDSFVRAFDFWPHQGTTEIQYDFDAPTRVSSVSVSWFDDLANGGDCALPASWRLLARSESGAWEQVKNLADYTILPSKLVHVAIDPSPAGPCASKHNRNNSTRAKYTSGRSSEIDDP